MAMTRSTGPRPPEAVGQDEGPRHVGVPLHDEGDIGVLLVLGREVDSQIRAQRLMAQLEGQEARVQLREYAVEEGAGHAVGVCEGN